MPNGRIRVQVILAVLFVVAEVLTLAKHRWFDAFLIGVIYAQVLIAAYRRRKTPDA